MPPSIQKTSFIQTRGFSVAEVMVIMVILSIAIVGVFGLVRNGLRLTNLTENRVTALNLAREWLEAVANIRDTNWYKYANDKDYCWMTAHYDGACIANIGRFYRTWSYVVFRSFVTPGEPPTRYEYEQSSRLILPVDDSNTLHDQWILLSVGNDIDLKNRDITKDPFTIYLDDRSLPYQVNADIDALPQMTCTRWKGSTSREDRTKNCSSIFHRMITLEFASDVENFGLAECFDYEENVSRCVQAKALIQWTDGTRRQTKPYEITLSRILTNWKEGI